MKADRVLKKMSGNHFFYKGDPCDLDPSPKEHRINRGEVLTSPRPISM